MSDNQTIGKHFVCHIFDIEDVWEAHQAFSDECAYIKDYGEVFTLNDGTVLHNNYCDFGGGRYLKRCKVCGGYMIHQSSIFEDGLGGAYGDFIPVLSAEEGDLLNILLTGDELAVYPYHHFRGYYHEYYWEGEGKPGPYDPDELREEIRKKYSRLDPEQKKQLEVLIQEAGK